MNEIIEYQVVHNDYWNYIRTEVNELMARGWEPLGGVAVDSDGCYQAMVRRREN